MQPSDLPAPPACPQPDAPGAFDATTLQWKSGCTYYKPKEAYDRVKGRHLSFGGDSLVRQLWWRAVAHLRGQPESFDRIFRGGAMYRRNSSHDELHISFKGGPPLPDVGPLGPEDVVLTFTWAPSHNPSQRDGLTWTVPVEELLAGSTPPTVVYGILYWRDPKATLEADLPSLEALARRARQLLWLTTPWQPGVSSEDNAAYVRRNVAMRAWAAETRGVTVLPFDRLADADVKQRLGLRVARVHYGCGVYDGRKDYREPFRAVPRRPAAPRRCKDKVNLALWQSILWALVP